MRGRGSDQGERLAAQASAGARMQRALPLVLAGLLAGGMVGAGAVGDIRDSLRSGRIGSLFTASALPPPLEAEASPPVAAGPAAAVDAEIAETYGYAAASQLGLTDSRDCATLTTEFRSGCLAYVEAHRTALAF
jgi:hypothetical protein